MKNDKDKSADAAGLRRRAEERLRESKKREAARPGTKEETQRLLHELQVHQIELEMQNEELQQARAEVETGLAQYTDLHNFTPVGCFTLDRDGAISQVNLTGASLLGIERSRLVKRRFGLFVSDESRPAFNAFLKKVFENQAKETCETALRTDGNEPVWVHIEANASEDGQGCRAAVVDITERMRTEEARRQAEENFRRSMDESPLGIRIVSAKGETLYANRAILDIYGYKDIEELKSTPVKNRYTHESYAEYQLRKKKRMNGEDYSSEYEISIIRKTGENRRLRVLRKGILWNGQKQFQTIYQDITERKRAEEQLQKSLQQTKKVLEEVVWALSSIVERRDPYTAGHQRGVAELACALAGELNLPGVQIEGIRVAGLIHDIGKMNVPTEILSKTGRLSEAEFNIVKTHSQNGKEILESIDFPWPVAQIVHQHHERLNGTGYPQGLSDGKIILEAKIIAVADVVEAMASHRPYRPALGVEKALEEISSQRSLLYDPQVVDACRELFDKKGYKLA
jgi:PAS domain S-box-containing protein/putative nucleotidyltransferase with HDIG domain